MCRNSFLPHMKPMWLKRRPFCSTTSAAQCWGRQMAAANSLLQSGDAERRCELDKVLLARENEPWGWPTAMTGGGGAARRDWALGWHRPEISPFSGQSPYFAEVVELVRQLFDALFAIAISEELRLLASSENGRTKLALVQHYES
jgi:hypothetical protein